MGLGTRAAQGLLAANVVAVFAICSSATAHPGQVETITDGGFEETICPASGDLACYNPNWDVTVGYQVYPCYSPPCTTNAASGLGFLGLGGAPMLNFNEEGSASQEADLPETGSKMLTFELRAGYDDTFAAGTLVALADGQALLTRTYAQAPSSYETMSVDLGGYSGPTTLSFKILCSRVAAPIPVGCDSFFVDDVSLVVDPGTEPTVETNLQRTPDRTTSRRRASFAFTSVAPEATFRCRLDGEALGSCASPMRLRVDPGRHRFSVRAQAGMISDPTPARFRWRVTKAR